MNDSFFIFSSTKHLHLVKKSLTTLQTALFLHYISIIHTENELLTTQLTQQRRGQFSFLLTFFPYYYSLLLIIAHRIVVVV